MKALSNRINFCHMTEEEIKPHIASLQTKYPQITLEITANLSLLSINVKGKGDIEAVIEALHALKPTHVFPSENGSIEEAIHHELIARKETLAVAESCTGGLISTMITKQVGASEYFLAGLTTYSNLAKHSVLGVSEQLLEKQGAVNELVAQEMVKGLYQVTNATWLLSVTGVAGPTGGTEEKPVGTIYSAIGYKNEEIISGQVLTKKHLPRDVNIKRTANWILGALWRKMMFNENVFND